MKMRALTLNAMLVVSALFLLIPLEASAYDWDTAWELCEDRRTDPNFCYADASGQCLPVHCTTIEYTYWWKVCIADAGTPLSSNLCWTVNPPTCPGNQELIYGVCDCPNGTVNVGGTCVDEPAFAFQVCMFVGDSYVHTDEWDAIQVSMWDMTQTAPSLPTENNGCRGFTPAQAIGTDYVVSIAANLNLSGANDLTILLVDATGETPEGVNGAEMLTRNTNFPEIPYNRNVAEIGSEGEYIFREAYSPDGDTVVNIYDGIDLGPPTPGDPGI